MQWDWQFFCDDIVTQEHVAGCIGRGDVYTYLNWLFSAWGWTAAVSISALALALLAGSIVGTLRTLPNRRVIPFLAASWIELFRNIPLLVQIFIWYHVIPVLVPAMHGVSSFVLVVCALGLFTSARVAEQVRAGIQSLPSGQRYASMAMGFTTPQTYRFVLLPLAMRIVLPPLTSESMNIVKNSAAAFAVSIAELTMYALQVQEETSRGIEVYLAVTVLYAITALIVFLVMNWIEQKMKIPGFGAGRGR